MLLSIFSEFLAGSLAAVGVPLNAPLNQHSHVEFLRE
jgi:hypothetical protein